MLVNEPGSKPMLQKFKMFMIIISIVIALVAATYFMFNADLATDNIEPKGDNAVRTVINNNVIAEENIVQNDAAAVSKFCEDVTKVSQDFGGTGGLSAEDLSKFRDLCVVSTVANEYIPQMTDKRLSHMLATESSCLETGIDKNGYNCFTGHDKNECGRDGVTKEGTMCTPVAMEAAEATQTPESLSVSVVSKPNGCDDVTDCSKKQAHNNTVFNAFGCNHQGYRKDGSLCPKEIITQSNNTEGFDQFGFDEAGYNRAGCNVNGVNRYGNVCDISKHSTGEDPGGDLIQYGLVNDDVDQNEFPVRKLNVNNCEQGGANTDNEQYPVSEPMIQATSKPDVDENRLAQNKLATQDCNVESQRHERSLCVATVVKAKYHDELLLYVGVGQASGEVNASMMNKRMQALGYLTSAEVSDLDRKAWQFRLDYRFNPYMALQYGYQDLGEVRTRLTGAPAQIEDFLHSSNVVHPRSAEGPLLGLQLRYPITAKWQLQLAYQYFWQKSYYLSQSYTASAVLDRNSHDWFWSAGVSYQLSQRWQLNFDLESIDVQGEPIKVWRLGTNYRFWRHGR
jgi:opacity protein-like surface antigen